ncbi:MAG: shikimate kinase [Desulfobacterales bacterium]|nr:shikimate kinase [Desulfobacterales bacterium]
MNIFLIGFRCTGKTTIGRIIADTLQMGFIDADDEIVKQQGMPISDIVDKHGWDYFREKESGIIKEISDMENHVVATGGGVVLNKDNVAHMKKSGIVIWLRANPETVQNRILQDEKTKQSRPSLTSKGLIDEIEETMEIRKPYYQEAMEFYIDTDKVEIDEVAGKILENLDAG